MVSDGKYHMVELLAIKKNFTLRVDRGLARSIINEGSKDFLKLSTPLFLGGLPIESGQQAFKNWHLRNLTSFKGCMKEVWINHKQVDFGNAARQQKVTPGCALLDSDSESNEQEEVDVMQETQHVLREEVCRLHTHNAQICKLQFDGTAFDVMKFSTLKQVDPCSEHKCRRGSICVANTNSKEGYACRCKIGTRGKYCEQSEGSTPSNPLIAGKHILILHIKIQNVHCVKDMSLINFLSNFIL